MDLGTSQIQGFKVNSSCLGLSLACKEPVSKSLIQSLLAVIDNG